MNGCYAFHVSFHGGDYDGGGRHVPCSVLFLHGHECVDAHASLSLGHPPNPLREIQEWLRQLADALLQNDDDDDHHGEISLDHVRGHDHCMVFQIDYKNPSIILNLLMMMPVAVIIMAAYFHF